MDIKVYKPSILLLFNSPSERAIHCFRHSGVFLREVMHNNRGLQDPSNVCVNAKGIIFISDGNIEVNSTYIQYHYSQLPLYRTRI